MSQIVGPCTVVLAPVRLPQLTRAVSYIRSPVTLVGLPTRRHQLAFPLTLPGAPLTLKTNVYSKNSDEKKYSSFCVKGFGGCRASWLGGYCHLKYGTVVVLEPPTPTHHPILDPPSELTSLYPAPRPSAGEISLLGTLEIHLV